ncbi:WASH complex subunit 2 [Coccinella septempunctata]|uniref:WASH complex subunit 2 n=1 Tax=Coccinella septempunctata TaxID=41139 RepID=UPI001D06E83F|nr:WASH complex subunit 2 [Coccinella septempunctata]
MSNSIIPHLLSDSPPPLVPDDEDFEDEFGDFKGPEELSFDNEIPSTPSSLNNSKDDFPDTYTDFNDISNDQKSYEMFSTSKEKPTTNIISTSPVSYFSIWEQIENNIPAIIDNNEDIQESKDETNSLENKGPNNLSTIETYDVNESTENLKKPSDKNNQIEFEHIVASESSEKQISKKLEPVESVHSSNENIDFQHVQYEIEIIQSEQIQTENIGEIGENKILFIKPSDEILKIEENHDINAKEDDAGECFDEKDNDFPSSKLVSEHLSSSDTNSFQLTAFEYTECTTVENDVISSGINEVPSVHNLPIAENQESKDDFDEFADFSSCTLKNNISDNVPSLSFTETNEDDFHEFGSYQNITASEDDGNKSQTLSTSLANPELVQNENLENDDFDDFTSYSANNEDNDEKVIKEESFVKICKSPEEAVKETQSALDKMFPKNECTTADYSNCDYVMNNSVFEDLKDITETNALTYQWGKSCAQKNILKTLNIDVRNILYGPSWNSGVPIFAANLCSKPLEPIKSELPVPIISPQKNIETQESTSTIPEFDWSGSGLASLQDSATNLTDETPKIIEETSNLKIKAPQQSYADVEPIQPKLSNFEHTLPKNSNHFEVMDKEEENDDFSDFTSYQGTEEKEEIRTNIMPLRESHISSNTHQNEVETDKISKYFQELTMGRTEAIHIDQLKENSKFSFIDGSLQLSKNQQLSEGSSCVFSDSSDKSKINSVQVDVSYDQVKTDKPSVPIDRSNNCDILTDAFEIINENVEEVETISSQSYTKNQEDEFTDFQSSLPCPAKQHVEPTLLEPLKPSVLKPEKMKNQPVKIEWPEPGLDEEEINRIVNGVRRKSSTSENVKKKANNTGVAQINTKKPVDKGDQEDWSDFMCVKEPLKTRTSTPDLPLSVFNLGSIQSNRVSAPYVAPNGVVHSPSKTPSISFPVVNRNSQNTTHQSSHEQPFITSQAFNALYSNSKNNMLLPNTHIGKTGDMRSNNQFFHSDKANFDFNCSENNISISFPQNGDINHRVQQHIPSSITHSNAEDDDWGDFVSAPSTISQSNSSANFFQPSSYMRTNLGFSGKSVPIQKSFSVSKNTVVRQEKNNLPIISTMPDLDFVSPKSRNSIK